MEELTIVGDGKLSHYAKPMTELKAQIGKHAAEHRVAETIRFHAKRYPEIKEAALCIWAWLFRPLQVEILYETLNAHTILHRHSVCTFKYPS